NRRAEQAKRCDFRDQLGRETRLVEAITNDRQDLVVDEARDRILHHAFLFGKQRADVIKIKGIEAGRHAGFSGGKHEARYCSVIKVSAPERPLALSTGRRPSRRLSQSATYQSARCHPVATTAEFGARAFSALQASEC